MKRRKFKATFENGGFWEYYRDPESQFEDFLRYVPYVDSNANVCSYRLANLLQNIGAHVDSAFKEMAKYPEFSKNLACGKILTKVKKTRKNLKVGKKPMPVSVKECLSAFETEYKLSTKKVVFKRLPEREDVIPFTPFNTKTQAPQWWDIYNGLKHDFGENFEKATLEVTRNGLAGAFLLNAMHVPGAFRLCEYGLVKDLVGNTVVDCKDLKRILDEKGQIYYYAETSLFVYNFNQ